MCPNPARLATALALVLATGALATPAFALFGKAKPAPAAAAQTASPAAPQAAPAAQAPRRATPAERAAAERLDPLTRAAFWAREASVDPNDADAGIHLARSLRQLGRYDEAVQAADLVLVGAPNNAEALIEDARAKISAKQGFYAIEILKRVRTLSPRDWRPLSLMGVALEQSQRPDEAREAYAQALALSPENPAVLSNLGLYYANHGDPAQAEAMLRRAVARPDAGAPERQNLALVLGLQGKVAEAERLIRQDLPPDVADANLAYLRAASASDAPMAIPTASAAPPPGARTWGTLGGQAPARP